MILTSTKTSPEIEKIALDILGEHAKIISTSSPFNKDSELFFLRMKNNLKVGSFYNQK